MKKTLLFLWIIAIPITALSQYNVLQIPSEDHPEEKISKLDSLRIYYNGKHIQFFSRNNDVKSVEWLYYGNFYSQDPAKLLSPFAVTPQTDRNKRISMYDKGIRKTKKVLPSIRYKSQKAYEYLIVFDDGFRHGNVHPFGQGYFTPYPIVEGRTFQVRDIQQHDCLNRNILYGLKRIPGHDLPFDWNVPIWIFELEDEQGERLFWMTNKGNYVTAVFIVEEVDAVREAYIGNYYYIRQPSSPIMAGKSIKELSTNKYTTCYDRLLAKDIMLTADDNSRKFYTPHLLLEDDHGKTYKIEIVNGLKLETVRPPDHLTANIDWLIPEGVILAERAAEQERQQEQALRREREVEKSRLEHARREEETRKEQERIKKTYISKYGTRNADLILAERVALGMTKQMCIEAWGEPESVNRTVTRYGTSEQWVYGLGTYLYFEGNKLTGIQE